MTDLYTWKETIRKKFTQFTENGGFAIHSGMDDDIDPELVIEYVSDLLEAQKQADFALFEKMIEDSKYANGGVVGYTLKIKLSELKGQK